MPEINSMNAALELRVLTGLQVGARLHLDEGRHAAGAGEACDIVLMGPGVEDRALDIVVQGTRLQLEPRQPGCGLVLGDSLSDPFVLEPGVPFHVGGVWLVIDHAAGSWPKNGTWLQPVSTPLTVPLLDESLPERPIDAPAREGLFQQPMQRRPWWIWVGRSMAVLFLTAVVAFAWQRFGPDHLPDLQDMSASLLSTFRSKNAPSSDNTGLAVAREEAAAVDAPQASAHRTGESSATFVATPPEVPRTKQTAAQLQLLEPFANRLSAAGRRSILAGTERAEDIGGSLASTEQVAGEPVHLPFSVRQVVCGSAASITTDGGVKLFEGASHKGYQLMRVAPDRLRLRGRDEVEMSC